MPDFNPLSLVLVRWLSWMVTFSHPFSRHKTLPSKAHAGVKAPEWSKDVLTYNHTPVQELYEIAYRLWRTSRAFEARLHILPGSCHTVLLMSMMRAIRVVGKEVAPKSRTLIFSGSA